MKIVIVSSDYNNLPHSYIFIIYLLVIINQVLVNLVLHAGIKGVSERSELTPCYYYY